MTKKKSLSVPKMGMDRDTHLDLLKQTQYTLSVNATTETEVGETLNISNEPSNYLALVLPEGYKVIGFKYNLVSERTYLWLTNPTTKKSSIGYIDNQEFTQDNVDTFNNSPCLNCNNQNDLDTPLEEQTQLPYLQYNELVHDVCLPIGEGLNFDINFPIKNIVIKNEKGSVTSYWDDYNNPSRYMVMSDVSYLYTEEVPCDDNTASSCLLVDKLLHFPNHSIIKINPELIQVGGTLKLGTYEFWGAYCDAQGNNITNYFTPTQPINIFDENNILLEQTELDSFTNYSIKLKIEGLDKTFPYYKIVCVERTNVTNQQTAFLEDIHPTSDDTVVYSSSGSINDDEYLYNGNARIRRRVDLYELQQIKPKYEKAEGTTNSGNMLWKWGLKEKSVMNLQPVVNLFGSLMRWQTSITKEKLFKSPLAPKGYMREEVQPFSLRFFTKDGEYTPTFPIIARPLLFGEDDFIEDINYESLSVNTPNCAEGARDRRWQIFNTATEIERVGDDTWDCDANLDVVFTQDEITKTCKISNVASAPTGSATIVNPQDFTTLEQYINDNPSVDIPGITEYLEDTYPSDHCTPNFGFCDTPSLVSSRNKIQEIIGETAPVYTTKSVADYQKSIPPSFCNNFKKSTSTGSFIQDVVFMNSFMNCDGSDREITYFRDFDSIQNEDCSYATPIINNNITSQSGQSYYHNYYGDTTLANLLDARDAFSSDTDFQTKLHKGALWFKVDKLGRDKIILELSKNTICSDTDDIPQVDKLRFSVYEDCSATTAVSGDIISITSGVIFEVDSSTLPDTFFVAVDVPIVTEVIPVVCSSPLVTQTVYRVSPPCGCFSIYTRDVQYASLDISWESVIIDKYETYTALCSYVLPKVDDCTAVPYANGEFAYWESTEQYPNNEELYNSFGLQITTTDLVNLKAKDKERFEQFYVDSIAGTTYNLRPETDFRCANIRHPKMPSNLISPFMIDFNYTPFAESIVFPLGVTIDANVITTMLQVAFNNNLISKKELDSIAGYEILRGDNTVNKSVLANGLGYDMYSYSRDNKNYLYANYPFNDLGNDILHYENQGRNSFVQHPFSGEGNTKFSIISPDLLFNAPTLATEIVLAGYQLGNSRGKFTEVREHPKWTILGKKARTTADVLAIAEVALETLIKIAEMTSQQWFTFGVSSGASLGYVGASLSAVAYSIQGFTRVGQYRYQWLETFRNLGAQYNFAHYNVAEGYHNNFLPNDSEQDYIRGISLAKYLKDREYQFIDENTGERLLVNNYLREASTLISLGDISYGFGYLSDYSNYDNSNIDASSSSRTIASENSCSPNEEYIRNVGSPYMTLKNYIVDQWGQLDSIKWLTTNHIFNLGENRCETIFGGTVSISRFTDKRKMPMFKATAMKLPNRLAVEYLAYKNIAEPRFFCDYEMDTEKSILGIPFPDIDSDFEFDCENAGGFYIKPDSKFYLYYYGITNFLVESEINCNFRYGKREPKNQFYNDQTDIVEWTQEVNVPIKEPNTFYYNSVYSLPVSNSPYRYLDNTFNRDLWEQRANQENAVIYSEVDNSQNEIFDPWKVYKPLNWYEFDKNNGKLIALKDLESSQLLGRFENGMVIFNAIDSLADRITPQNKTLGTGGVFTTRPLEFKKTDLGFAGTQHTDMVSTPWGHFWVDAKRGKVFMLDQSGKSLEPISEVVGGKPTGMKNWFKEHLPMKILKQIPQINTDNKFRGIGYNIYYDSRFDRVFITKRDYVLKLNVEKQDFYYDEPTRKLYYQEEEVDFDNQNIFENVSFTIAFKAGEGWSSYFTFYPDYTITTNEQFQNGFNWGQDQGTLWTHNLGKSSFQVFQGRLNPFIVEYPIVNENTNKILNSISLEVESKRWQNEWDFAIHSEIGFNKAMIWNNKNNSHLLELVEQRSLSQVKDFPKTKSFSQEILFTNEDGKHNFNYFYNRIKNERNNIPALMFDKNRIFKEIDPNAVSFKGKPILERIRGNAFNVTLTNDKESRFNIILKTSINEENTYE